MAIRPGVSWPTKGDATTFRRRVGTIAVAGTAGVAAALAASAWYDATLLRPLVPLAMSALLLLGLWAHGTARRAARRAEVERSFAGLVVVHHGQAYAVSERPLEGEYPTRRHAATAAMDRGAWALVVHAWDRYYLLSCTPARATAEGARPPVSFRSRAVSDVVPAISA